MQIFFLQNFEMLKLWNFDIILEEKGGGMADTVND